MEIFEEPQRDRFGIATMYQMQTLYPAGILQELSSLRTGESI